MAKHKMALHTQILLGMLAGAAAGWLLAATSWGKDFSYHWIQPWGTIFVRMLKMIAVPLILASLVKGISDLKDIVQFRKIGIRTLGWYVLTTVTAISIGLILVNTFRPGDRIDRATVEKLQTEFSSSEKVQKKIETARSTREQPALQFLVDMVPANVFDALADNRRMLQVIFFAVFLGIAMVLLPAHKVETVKSFFDGFNEIILKMVDLIMLMAPYAVFALIAHLIVSTGGDWNLMSGLLWYALTVTAGLLLMIGFYMLLVKMFARKNPLWFLRQLSPAQLLAFSTSSSAATLPVTMERVEEHIGVDKEVSGFVLPVGATVNMDGTSLYQAVAAVFILQVLWPEGLGLENQLTIILTALLASIGAAAVPGAGMVMLVIVLEALGFPPEKLPIGLALIFAIDRPLDMLRTVINVTGDATVATLVAKSTGKLHEPRPKEWDDYLPPTS
ncbi:MAG: dicarboxylate/amino acid:cation symporter [Chlorobi bacterium]|nr:dicarboxylate/amino acid:cation symporter [Chlorobiota bacterium]